MSQDQKISIVIPNYNGSHYLGNCLSSVLRSTVHDIEILVVDNGSRDGSRILVEQIARRDSRVRLISLSKNEGVTVALNKGILAVNTVYVALLNNDTEVAPDWLEEPLRILENPTIAGVQSKLIGFASKKIDSAGCFADIHGCVAERGRYLFNSMSPDLGQFEDEREIFSAGCPASLYRRQAILEAGLFDPEFFAGYEDADLCWRIRLLGYRIFFAPTSIVFHHRSGTSSKPTIRRKIRFHFAKNRMAMLVKNLELTTLVSVFPLVLFVYMSSMIHYSRSSPLEGVESIRGLAWNVSHARKIIRSRAQVQGTRRISDRELKKAMTSKCVFVSHYLKPFLLGYS